VHWGPNSTAQRPVSTFCPYERLSVRAGAICRHQPGSIADASGVLGVLWWTKPRMELKGLEGSLTISGGGFKES
jgi:hypothetical protein